MLTLIAWTILLVLAWPLALAVLIIWPLLWLLSIPLRFVALLLTGVLALLGALFLLPARLLGWKPKNR